MATISDGTIFLLFSQLAIYFVLYTNKQRIYRLIGGGAMMAVGLSAVMIEDTVPAFVFAGVSIIIAMYRIITDLTSLV